MDPILAVVRGEAPVSSLKGHTAAGPARPALPDLAAGIARYARHKRGFKGWAQLLIRSDFIDLQPDESSSDWDILMTAIWDAAAGSPPGPGALATAHRILASDVIPS